MSTRNFVITEHVIPGQHIRQYPKATANIDQDELQIAIKQYSPKDNLNPQPGDITLIAAHANGVMKELYEPLWDGLYEQSRRTGSFRIRSIWMADVAWQGASAVLNEDKLGIDPSWWDHPRDLLHMVNVFRAQMVPPLFGLGHSLGGCNIASLALMHPSLFSNVILLEPVIQRSHTAKGNYLPAYMSSFRRDIWPSREFAAEQLRSNPFYQAWDPRCLDLLIKHGFRELPTAVYPEFISRPAKKGNKPDPPPTTPVTLTTPKHQEVFTFLRPKFPEKVDEKALETHSPPRRTHPDVPSASPRLTPFYRPEPIFTFDSLPHLRPRVLYVFGGDSPVSDLQSRTDKMKYTGTGDGGNGGRDVDNATAEVVMQGRGHFIPFEDPDGLAEAMLPWLEHETKRWKAQDEIERREWQEIKKQRHGLGRFTMSDEFLQWMRKHWEMVQRDQNEPKPKI